MMASDWDLVIQLANKVHELMKVLLIHQERIAELEHHVSWLRSNDREKEDSSK
jgi:hypothetical protein